MLAPMILLFILPFPGTVALRLVALALAVFTAAWRWRRLRVPRFPCKIAIAFWAGIAIASFAYAVDPSYTLGEIKNEVGYSLLAFVSLFALTTDETRLRLAVLAVAAALLVITIAAAATYASTGAWAPLPWYGGSPGTTNYVMMAVPAAGLAAFLWIPNPNSTKKTIGALISLVMLIGILATERAIWPALGAQGLVVAWWLSQRGHFGSRHRKAALIAAVVVALAVGGFAINELQRRSADPAAAMERDLRPNVWRNALERIFDSPLTGAGLGRQAFWKADRDLVPPENLFYWHTHNMVLNYGVSAGVPGMLAILSLFVALGWRFGRLALDENQTIAIVGLVGLLMFVGVFARNMFNDFFVRDGALLFWSLSGAFFGYALRARSTAPNREAGLASR